MSCEICGKSSCAKSFHSTESQDKYDKVADVAKERAANSIKNSLDNLDYEHIGDDAYIKLSDAIEVCDNYS